MVALQQYIPGGVAFLMTLFAITLLRPLAIRLGLVDKPGGRKLHSGNVPLIGGIAMFIGFAFALLTLNISLASFRSLLAASGLLVIVGLLDDFHELSTRSRFFAQIFAGLLMSLWGHNFLYTFGNLLYSGNINLYWLSIPITIFATTGIINAVNMTDGVDGLAGSLVFIEIMLLSFLAWHIQDYNAFSILTIMLAAVLGFLIFNWQWPGKEQAQVFMGDAGSMFLGFILSWFLIGLSQGPHLGANPVIMLWIVAIPLFDTTWLLIKRTLQARSPLVPGRDHLHHLLQRYGFSSLQITLFLSLLTLLFGLIGIAGSIYRIQQGTMFISFIGLFIVYSFFVHSLWQYKRLELESQE